MKLLIGHLMYGGKITWEDMPSWEDEEGITISFPIFHKTTAREASKVINESLRENGLKWLTFEKLKWSFVSDQFLIDFPSFKGETWLNGHLILTLEHEIRKTNIFNEERDETIVRFVITPELVRDQLPKRIFLSHKGIDKPQIRKYKSALEIIGLNPWLDEDAMVAGVELERGLLQGFKQSCAAVFFVTPNYKDSGYLATEINYAIQEKRAKGDRFSIITLMLPDEAGKTGKVPELLQQYVWKSPKSELDAFCEIIKALPITFSSPVWK